MTTEEYRKTVVEPALKKEAEVEEFFKKLRAASKPVPKKRKHEEDDLTIAVTNYCEGLKLAGKVIIFSHIPASTYTKYWTVKKKNTAMGVRPGVPDMLIVFPNQVLFLELKREKGGVVSAYQQQWLDALSATGKVVAKVAHGWAEAHKIIDSIVSSPQ